MLYISKESPISSLLVGTLNPIEYTTAVLNHFVFPLQLITKMCSWELWTPVNLMEEETQQKNHQEITMEEGEEGSGSLTEIIPGPMRKYN